MHAMCAVYCVCVCCGVCVLCLCTLCVLFKLCVCTVYVCICIYSCMHDSDCIVLQKVHINLDYSADESYTPSKIAVLAGSYYHDLQVSRHWSNWP